MQILKTRWFSRFARREGITDNSLREAIERAERGLVNADLGGGLIKQRVARQGQGRSGGYRVIIAYRAASKAFFLHGFAKNDQENIGEDELIALRKFGRRLLTADVETLKAMFEDGSLKEVDDDKEE
ncbi:MAG: type II toxin-antitoxin system RelE/ParE family toxin [Terracidiphilus sp.]|jgi:hypothetical protein